MLVSRRQWRNISNIIKERKYDPKIFYQAKLTLKDKEPKLLVQYKNSWGSVLLSTS